MMTEREGNKFTVSLIGKEIKIQQKWRKILIRSKVTHLKEDTTNSTEPSEHDFLIFIHSP